MKNIFSCKLLGGGNNGEFPALC